MSIPELSAGVGHRERLQQRTLRRARVGGLYNWLAKEDAHNLAAILPKKVTISKRLRDATTTYPCLNPGTACVS
jgi:hypothetical protein